MTRTLFIPFLALVFGPIFGFAEILDSPSSNCVSMPSSPSLSALLGTINRTVTVAAGISNYRISDYDIVLLDSYNFPNCKLMRNKQGEVSVESTEPIKIENGVYEFCGGLKTKCPIPQAGSRTNGVTVFDIGPLAKKTQEVYPANSAEMANLFSFSLLAHEGFHFYIQTRLFDQTSFPEYNTFMEANNRQIVGEKCYGGSKEIESLVSQEMHLLHQAFVAARNGLLKQRSLLLKSFIETREKRYGLVSNIKIHEPGATLTCRAAEARMEVGEGLADFAGLWSLGQTMGWTAVDKYYQVFFDDMNRSKEHYYRLGSLQIFSLISDDKTKTKVFSSIINSKTPEEAIANQVYSISQDQTE